MRIELYKGEERAIIFDVTAAQEVHFTAWDAEDVGIRGRWYIENGRMIVTITQSGSFIVNQVGKAAIINLTDINGKEYTKYKIAQ